MFQRSSEKSQIQHFVCQSATRSLARFKSYGLRKSEFTELPHVILPKTTSLLCAPPRAILGDHDAVNLSQCTGWFQCQGYGQGLVLLKYCLRYMKPETLSPSPLPAAILLRPKGRVVTIDRGKGALSSVYAVTKNGGRKRAGDSQKLWCMCLYPILFECSAHSMGIVVRQQQSCFIPTSSPSCCFM